MGTPVNLTAEMEVDVSTYMLAGKFSPNIGSDTVRPFIVGGVSAMHAEYDMSMTASVMGLPISASDSESHTGATAKVGLGADIFITKKVSIGIEGSYVWGVGPNDDIRYISIPLYLAYHF